MFLGIAATVFVLIYLANVQMMDLFQQYLIVQHAQLAQQAVMPGTSMVMVMGPLEESFMASVHQSLIWVGMVILAIGLAASYAVARSITVPLRRLSRAAEQIERGNFVQVAAGEGSDEIGHLAAVFNRMSQSLSASTKLRRQLLANIAHELRTPLAIIQGHLEGMIDEVIEPSQEQLLSLHEEAVRLNRLITDLRDLSLAEVKELALEKEPVELNELLQRIVALLKPLFDQHNLTVDCHFAEALPELVLDHQRMSQVFNNILLNAIRYAPPHSVVLVRTLSIQQGTTRWLGIEIADQGPGIAAEDLPHVFEHFYRGDKSRDRKSGGSGLGLAIVKHIVESHGGTVAVRSALQQGTTVSVWLPIDSDWNKLV